MFRSSQRVLCQLSSRTVALPASVAQPRFAALLSHRPQNISDSRSFHSSLQPLIAWQLLPSTQQRGSFQPPQYSSEQIFPGGKMHRLGARRQLSSAAEALVWVQQVSAVEWWLVLGGSALAIRSALLPLSFLTVRSSTGFARAQAMESLLTPKLAAGPQSILTTLSKSKKARTSAGLMVASPVAQMGTFFYVISTVRELVTGGASGLESGGTLWFIDLTLPGAGVLGFVFPGIIATNFIVNVNRSFGNDDVHRARENPLVLGVHWVKWALQFVGFSSFIIACSQPQGVLVYWASASSLAALQTLLLQNRSNKPTQITLDTERASSVAFNYKTAEDLEAEVEHAAYQWSTGEQDAAIATMKSLCHQGNSFIQKAVADGTFGVGSCGAKDAWHALALYGLGRMLFARQDFEAAAESLTQSAKSKALDKPRQCAAWILAATAFANRGMFIASSRATDQAATAAQDDKESMKEVVAFMQRASANVEMRRALKNHATIAAAYLSDSQ